MTDTDDKTLTEQIARALYLRQANEFRHPDDTETPEARWDNDQVFFKGTWIAEAENLLPIIRKAQADALRDAAREEFQFSPNVHYQGIRVHERLVKRADRIEKGTDHD